MGLPARFQFLFSRLCRRRNVRRLGKYRAAGRALPAHAAAAEHEFQRPAHPRIFVPEAIIDGKAEGYPWIGKSIEHQFARFAYPAPGHAPVRMLYKYGGSIL